MWKYRFTGVLLIWFSVNTSVMAQRFQAEYTNNLSEKVNSIMDPLVASNNYAGNVLIAQYDTIWLAQSYGMMNERNQLENSGDTKFFLASASMVFTAAAIMKLVDEGKLATSDTLSKFFPDYKHGSKITVHHMLAQRSGIPAWDGGLKLSNFNRDEPHTIEELFAYFKNDELLFEPGSNYSHGRSEYILLAGIIEKITGKKYGDYLQAAIFEPLGMLNSGHYAAETKDTDISNLAKGYTEKGFNDVEPAPRIHWSVKTGHASIYSTTGDLHLFARAALNKQLLSEESWRMILTDYGKEVGYGWFLNPQADHKRYQMNGRSPGFSSYLGIYPDEDLVVIMLSNRYVSLPYFIGPELAAAALGDPFEPLRLSTEDVPNDLANQVKGHYQMGPDFYRPNGTTKIKFRNGKMYSGRYPLLPVLDDDGNITAFIHRHYWSRLEFTFGEDGAPILHFDNFTGYKKGFFSEWKWVILGTILVGVLGFLIWRRKRSKVFT